MSVQRINELRKKLKAENLDGMVVSHLDHVRYLTGFTGTAGLLLLSPNSTDFFTDSRYAEQAKEQIKGAKIHIVPTEPIGSLKNFPEFNVKNRRYGYHEDYLSVSSRDRLQQSLSKTLLIPAASLVKEIGWVKDASEVASITKAVAISDKAFDKILPMVKPGVRESELRAELEYQMAMLGSEKPAFESIVASGYRSAMPHGVASHKKLQKGEFITFDFGAVVDGYVSDITRTVVLGKANQQQKKIYDLVLRAQTAGIKKVKAGIMAKSVDEACRQIINKAGYGKNFGHGTGHGIGFYIHVGPRVAGTSPDKLLPNNVITIEPGVYLPGWGGVRIEDDVVVTKTGGRVLNKAPKKLLEL